MVEREPAPLRYPAIQGFQFFILIRIGSFFRLYIQLFDITQIITLQIEKQISMGYVYK